MLRVVMAAVEGAYGFLKLVQLDGLILLHIE